MDKMCVYVLSGRPTTATVDGQDCPALELLGANGEHLILAMSGEGMKKLSEVMQQFLDEYPQLAKTRNRERQ
jgi:hypothetical protein